MHPRPRKRLGQHFLHDPAVVAKLVAAIAPAADDRMVEIGGGRGALTRPLLDSVQRLHVVEIDARLAEKLENSVADPKRMILHRADALKFDFSSLAPEPGSLRVVGNLPYNISTPLLFHLLDHREAIRDMHLMLQREVADRIAAAPGTKAYGRLTVMLAPWMEVRTCFQVGPGAFAPPPKVRSTVLRMAPRASPLFEMEDPPRFAKLVARAFSMRRKTLARSLRPWLARREIEAAGVDPLARPERIPPEGFERLVRAWRHGAANGDGARHLGADAVSGADTGPASELRSDRAVGPGPEAGT